VFDKEDLEKYLIKKRVKYLHILNDQIGEFADKIERDLVSLLHSVDATPEALDAAAVEATDVIAEFVSKIGLTPVVAGLIKSTSSVMVRAASSQPKLSALFANFEIYKRKYIAVHSNALAKISCAIASALAWNSESTFQKLTMASILHDITLGESLYAGFKVWSVG
jgi:HD-GYP domain-containing protein (c-di-GMP phosphodiesterase class II)